MDFAIPASDQGNNFQHEMKADWIKTKLQIRNKRSKKQNNQLFHCKTHPVDKNDN